MLAERFAFCQTMPLDDFLTTAEALRPSGYRPVRFRPYADGPAVRVAAVWTRDGRNWRIASGLTADEVRQQDERNRKEKFLPVDVAGYVAIEPEGKPADRYRSALGRESRRDDEARLYVGTTADDRRSRITQGSEADSPDPARHDRGRRTAEILRRLGTTSAASHHGSDRIGTSSRGTFEQDAGELTSDQLLARRGGQRGGATADAARAGPGRPAECGEEPQDQAG